MGIKERVTMRHKLILINKLISYFGKKGYVQKYIIYYIY